MKKLWLSVFELAGIKVDAAAIEANDKIVVSEENLASIKSKLEEAKGFEEEKNKALEDLKAKEALLATATTALEAAKTKATEDANLITELKAKVTELGAKPGATQTTAQVTGGTKETSGLPSYCDPNEEIYSLLQN